MLAGDFFLAGVSTRKSIDLMHFSHEERACKIDVSEKTDTAVFRFGTRSPRFASGQHSLARKPAQAVDSRPERFSQDQEISFDDYVPMALSEPQWLRTEAIERLGLIEARLLPIGGAWMARHP